MACRNADSSFMAHPLLPILRLATSSRPLRRERPGHERVELLAVFFPQMPDFLRTARLFGGAQIGGQLLIERLAEFFDLGRGCPFGDVMGGHARSIRRAINGRPKDGWTIL